MKTKITLFLLFLVLSSLQAQFRPVDNSKLYDLRKQIIKKIDSNVVSSISIGVSLRGEVVWKESFGWADKENSVKATPNTIYALGSLSKSLTATGIFVLLSQGRLSLADEVILKGSGHLSNPPTVAHLLAMEGGVPHFFRYVDMKNVGYNSRHDSQEFGITVFEPGKFHEYSNMSYGLLYNLIEKKSSIAAPTFFKTNVFDALAMSNSYCQLGSIEEKNTLAIPYDHEGSRLKNTQFIPIGGGGFYSSVSDLLRYGNFHIMNKNAKGEKFFSDDIFAQLHKPLRGQKNHFYNNGWGTLNYAAERSAFISNGAIAGAASTLLIEPKKQLVVVCLTNNSVGNAFTDEIAYQISDVIIPGFKSGIQEFFQRIESDFAPIEYKAKPDEKGIWAGSIFLEGKKVPFVISVSKDDNISFKEVGKSEIPLSNTNRQYNGLVSTSLEGISKIGEKSVEEFTATLTLDFEKEKMVGVLMLISNENQPDGLPYLLEAVRKSG